MSNAEKPDERAARLALEHIFGRPLDRVDDDSKAADYTITTDGHVIGFQVKRTTSQEFLKLREQTHREAFHPSERLTRHWSVMVNAPTMDDKFGEVPNFPEDDEETIARMAKAGFTTERKAERVARWRAEHSGAPTSTPSVRGLGRLLEPSFLELEAAGVYTTRLGWDDRRAVQSALSAIAQFGDLLCMGHEAHPDKGMPAGVDINFSYGQVRTERPDTIVHRLNGWLQTTQATKMSAALQRPEYDQRHGVVVFDATEPEYWTAQEQPELFPPRLALDLPPTLDALWALLGTLLLRYRRSDGWVAMNVPSPSE